MEALRSNLKSKATMGLLAVTAIVVLSVTWLSLEHPIFSSRPPRFGPPDPLALEHNTQPMARLIQTLFRSNMALDAKTFDDRDGVQWDLPGAPSWKEPLGKRLCILDIDTRPLDSKNHIMDAGPLHWNDTEWIAAGMLNHYMYAMVHGYDYHFVRTEKLSDRAVYWTKPMALSRVLKNYDMCISIDADAIFTNLNLPFEWLLNRWGIEKGSTSLGMARDPGGARNQDSFGRKNDNAGFIIAQNLPRTHDMLQAWGSCPDDEVRYPNCSKWKNDWPAEQRAFADYVRYEFNRTSDLVEIPCTEANGFPESHSGCDGHFVRHFWTGKNTELKPGIAHSFTQLVMDRIHEGIVEHKAEIILKDQPGQEV